MPDQADEAVADPSTQDILGWIWKIVWSICYPIVISIYYTFYYICFSILFLPKLLYEPLAFILLPIVYLVQFVWSCFLAPFRFIARFEVDMIPFTHYFHSDHLLTTD